MENERRLTFIDEEGNEILCEILFTFESKEFNKNYVLFYPVNGAEDEDDIEVMAASFIPGEEGNGELFPIETDEEWEMIEDVLEQFEEAEDGCGCGCEDDCDDEDCECEEEDEEDHCGCGHKH